MKKTSKIYDSDSRPNILCVVTDRMNLGLLGAYGNDWVGTEAFDRLSFESTLFDQYYATSLDLSTLYHAFWTGVEPATFTPTEMSDPSEKRSFFKRQNKKALPTTLPADFQKLGYRTLLLTDSREIADHPTTDGFDRIELLDWPTPENVAETVEETTFFSYFAQIADSVLNGDDKTPFFIWVHLTGFGGVWDFPTSLREESVEDEEDPAPYDGLIPPFIEEPLSDRSVRKRRTETPDTESIDREPNFDLFQAITETYAAGMKVWDHSLECLIDVLKDSGLFDKTMILLGSGRGFPLGEHERAGIPPKPNHEETSLFYSEELHLPLLIHFPDRLGESVRCSGICGPTDIYRTLAEFAAGDEKSETLLSLATEETDSIHNHLILAEKDATSRLRGVVTDEWFLIQRPDSPIELFVRPDDRWDVNEVADRCGETVEELISLMEESSEKKEG